MAQTSTISVANVTKTYLGGTFTAVEDVSLEIKQGEIVAFVGPSGCGKTTVMRMVAGLETPTSGVIAVNGHQVFGPGPDRGMVFQAYTSFPWLTARQNVEYGMRILGVPIDAPPQARGRASGGSAPWTGGRHVPRPNFPGGMKQRVAIARTLAQNPEVLLMDEPFGALDAQVRWEMQEMMIEIINAEQKTVILVTHDIQEAIYLADRVVFYTRTPGRIKEDVYMDFKKGQRFSSKEDLLGQPGYLDVEKELFAWMREEIRQ